MFFYIIFFFYFVQLSIHHHIFFSFFSQNRDKLISDLTDQLQNNDEFSSKEFLLAVIHKDNKLTKSYIDFESVGPISEGEDEFDYLNNPDAAVCDAFMENTCTQASTSSGTINSFGSSISSVSQAVDSKTVCSLCSEREKDSLMECGHTICGTCFQNRLSDHQAYCKQTFADQRTQRKEIRNFRCPYDRCGQIIKAKVQKMILDF